MSILGVAYAFNADAVGGASGSGLQSAGSQRYARHLKEWADRAKFFEEYQQGVMTAISSAPQGDLAPKIFSSLQNLVLPADGLGTDLRFLQPWVGVKEGYSEHQQAVDMYVLNKPNGLDQAVKDPHHKGQTIKLTDEIPENLYLLNHGHGLMWDEPTMEWLPRGVRPLERRDVDGLPPEVQVPWVGVVERADKRSGNLFVVNKFLGFDREVNVNVPTYIRYFPHGTPLQLDPVTHEWHVPPRILVF